jgi:hypothetical protein
VEKKGKFAFYFNMGNEILKPVLITG